MKMATISLNEKNFASEVTACSLPVLVDFYAEWCSPCRMVAPLLETLSGELEGKAKFAKVEVSENPDLARRYRVQSVPTMMIFRNGRVTDTLVGVVGKEQIEGLMI